MKGIKLEGEQANSKMQEHEFLRCGEVPALADMGTVRPCSGLFALNLPISVCAIFQGSFNYLLHICYITENILANLAPQASILSILLIFLFVIRRAICLTDHHKVNSGLIKSSIRPFYMANSGRSEPLLANCFKFS